MTVKARWWKAEDNVVRCLLCPHSCSLKEAELGICGVRAGANHELTLPGYGYVTAEGSDPIEKKPLYHFFPGHPVWSIGFAGCNLDCPFCQNHEIARASAGFGRRRSPDDVVAMALASGSRIIAYTYSEPSIHFEFLVETAEKAAQKGLLNVLVTSGCINPGPASELLDLMDGANIDVKSWNTAYYRDVLRGNLNTVRKFIETAVKRCWIELTTLVVPGDNDSEADITDMCSWIASLSTDIPLHLSAYHPAHRYNRGATGADSLERLRNLAKEKLNYVYVGNLGWENNTECPCCGKAVIERRFYSTKNNLKGNVCPQCGQTLPGVYSN